MRVQSDKGLYVISSMTVVPHLLVLSSNCDAYIEERELCLHFAPPPSRHVDE